MCTSVLTDSLLSGTSLVIPDHQAAIRRGRTAAQVSKKANPPTALHSILIPMDAQDAQRTTCNSETGAWIYVQPALVNRMSLSKDE